MRGSPERKIWRKTVRRLSTSSSGTSVLIGQAAPDFVLQDTLGGYHTLSEQLGKPVVLLFFATW